jgi:hypothetical protein
MIPIAAQNGAIQLLCLLQFALLMQGHRLLKYLFSGNRRARLIYHPTPDQRQSTDTLTLKW